MDDTPPPLQAPIPGAVPSSPFGAPPGVSGGFGSRTAAAPGRPADDPQKREASDKSYALAKEFEESLPADAREHRLAVYRLDPKTGFKKGHRPVSHILFSQVKEMRLQTAEGKGALENFILTTVGKGLYSCEPVTAHGQRLEKLAAFTVATSSEYNRVSTTEDPIDGDDAPRSSFGRRGRGRNRDEDDGDDEGDDRGTVDVKDMVDGFRQLSSETAGTAANSSNNMLQMMLLMSKEQRQADEARRREEREEERRREDKVRDERRIDEERRRTDEDRRRDERRAEERKEEERRREDREREAKAAESRMTMLTGLVTTLAPILGEVFKPKKDETLALVLGKVLDNSGQQSATKELITGMREMQTIGAQVQMEGAKSAMAMQSTMMAEMMKQAISMSRERPEVESAGGSWKDPNALAALMGSAASLMGQLLPKSAPAAPAGTAPALPAPQQPGQPAPTAPSGGAELPTGMEAVVRSMIAMQTGMDASGKPLTQEQQQLAVNIIFDEMPDDLAQAIATGDQAAISRISQPTILANPRYIQWVSQPDVQAWLGKFLTDLRPEVARMLADEAAEANAAAKPPAPPTAPAVVQVPTPPAPLQFPTQSPAPEAIPNAAAQPVGDDGAPV